MTSIASSMLLPVEEREQTKSFLSQSLLAVVTQILVKTSDARGRKAICEVLMMTKAIAKLIQTEPVASDSNSDADGPRPGHVPARTSRCSPPSRLARSIRTDAYGYAMDKRPFQKYVTDTKRAAQGRWHRRRSNAEDHAGFCLSQRRGRNRRISR